MNTSSIKAAVVGYGLAGRVFHCPYLTAVPGLELAAVVQRTGERAALDYPGIMLFRTVEEMLATPDIELVVVATPNDTHVQVARQALLAGKHVVVDKPLAPTSQEAWELHQLAAERKLILAPFHNRRWDGDFLTLRKLLQEGTLGRIVTVHSRFDRFRPHQRTGSWKEAGGPASGLLFDLGPHVVDQAIALFGVPQRITGSIRHDRDRTEIDDAFDLLLEYEIDNRALRYHCGATLLAAEPLPRFIVQGTRGCYIKLGLDPQEPTVLRGERPPRTDSGLPWLPEPESAWGRLTVARQSEEPIELKQSFLPTETGDYRNFYVNVRDTLLGRAALAVKAEDAVLVLRLLELALQSSQQGKALPVRL